MRAWLAPKAFKNAGEHGCLEVVPPPANEVPRLRCHCLDQFLRDRATREDEDVGVDRGATFVQARRRRVVVDDEQLARGAVCRDQGETFGMVPEIHDPRYSNSSCINKDIHT